MHTQRKIQIEEEKYIEAKEKKIVSEVKCVVKVPQSEEYEDEAWEEEEAAVVVTCAPVVVVLSIRVFPSPILLAQVWRA